MVWRLQTFRDERKTYPKSEKRHFDVQNYRSIGKGMPQNMRIKTVFDEAMRMHMSKSVCKRNETVILCIRFKRLLSPFQFAHWFIYNCTWIERMHNNLNFDLNLFHRWIGKLMGIVEAQFIIHRECLNTVNAIWFGRFCWIDNCNGRSSFLVIVAKPFEWNASRF